MATPLLEGRTFDDREGHKGDKGHRHKGDKGHTRWHEIHEENFFEVFFVFFVSSRLRGEALMLAT